MAPNRWVDGINEAANSLSNELQGPSGYNFEVSLGRGPALAPWVIAAIALAALAVLVCLVVACCRCCCRSESGRVIIAPQTMTPQIQEFTRSG